MRLLIQIMGLLFFFLTSCNAPKEIDQQKPEVNPGTENNTLSFYFLNIHNDTLNGQHIVVLNKQKEAKGKLKKKTQITGRNYLILYGYKNGEIEDSLTIKHPLYKHFEYVGDDKHFKVKDTLLPQADFVVRMQGTFNKLKIFEKIGNKPLKELNTLKL